MEEEEAKRREVNQKRLERTKKQHECAKKRRTVKYSLSYSPPKKLCGGEASSNENYRYSTVQRYDVTIEDTVACHVKHESSSEDNTNDYDDFYMKFDQDEYAQGNEVGKFLNKITTMVTGPDNGYM